jgi:lipoprotein-anchoring transpeptidase ErfK/SrfK
MVFVLRRAALFVALVLALALLAAAAAHAATRDQEVVYFSGFAPGTIVVKTSERRLYYVLNNQRALRFPVGVGRSGKTWTGNARVEGKFVRPAWAPPEEIRRDNPDLPDVIPGGAANNPMGEAALTLRGGEYAIHGTNRPKSIGGFVSYGCIRMHNEDIVKLYQLVAVGTPVIVER